MLKEFKEVIKPKHFRLKDLGDFYYLMKRKYPKLTQGRHKNFAEFTTSIKKRGKRTRQIKELSHTGSERMYDNFIDSIKNGDFTNGAVDANGIPKYNDSEIKWIYNFLVKHIDEGDEFVVESRNIFYACSSCQRELIIFKKYLESIGKKLDITLYGDIDIKGTSHLLTKLKEY